MVRISAALFWLSLISGCDSSVSSGELNGLKIGSTKEQVAEILASQGVSHIEPLPDIEVSVSSQNPEDVIKLNEEQGICISDNKGYSLNFKEVNGSPEIQYSSNSAEPDKQGIEKSSSISEAKQFIRKIITSNEEVTAYSCALEDQKITTAPINANAIERYNRFMYYNPGSYLTTTLNFNNGRLEEIEYHWRPFELP
ncbi:hypothetical protein [Pseudomonas sp. 5P_3.1_Bac2]|uniref:hypothetical protein n=1 Tax=Pseudomonas sp. 5P_3.1_Bac2 TaxID=2971617 RepID=UPI0021C99B64|nr:hypothetical protein [Pseudomonas sp. 5P_3.1_Bac2]MCU1716867.1 hypothetical protein [Pseudomonas sp. 5P_3.1_Bac2]